MAQGAAQGELRGRPGDAKPVGRGPLRHPGRADRVPARPRSSCRTRKPATAGTSEHPGPRDLYEAMGLNETQIEIIRTPRRSGTTTSCPRKGGGCSTSASVRSRCPSPASAPRNRSRISIASRQHDGDRWPFAWLDEQGVDYAALAVTAGRLRGDRVLPSAICVARVVAGVATPRPAQAQWAVTCVNCSTTWTQLLQYAKEAQSLETQLQQYQTQLQQYTNMVTNTVALPAGDLGHGADATSCGCRRCRMRRRCCRATPVR